MRGALWRGYPVSRIQCVANNGDVADANGVNYTGTLSGYARHLCLYRSDLDTLEVMSTFE